MLELRESIGYIFSDLFQVIDEWLIRHNATYAGRRYWEDWYRLSISSQDQTWNEHLFEVLNSIYGYDEQPAGAEQGK